jgi:hypothetical protein
MNGLAETSTYIHAHLRFVRSHKKLCSVRDLSRNIVLALESSGNAVVTSIRHFNKPSELIMVVLRHL